MTSIVKRVASAILCTIMIYSIGSAANSQSTQTIGDNGYPNIILSHKNLRMGILHLYHTQ